MNWEMFKFWGDNVSCQNVLFDKNGLGKTTDCLSSHEWIYIVTAIYGVAFIVLLIFYIKDKKKKK